MARAQLPAGGAGTSDPDTACRAETAGGGTHIRASQNLSLSGEVAQYGRGITRDVTAQLMRRFAGCVPGNLARPSRGQAERAAKPAQGLTLAIQALMAGITRFFRQLFGGKA